MFLNFIMWLCEGINLVSHLYDEVGIVTARETEIAGSYSCRVYTFF